MAIERLVIPFRAMSHDGLINVEMQITNDPSRTGIDAVAPVGHDEASFSSFPVVTATLDYTGTGESPRARNTVKT